MYDPDRNASPFNALPPVVALAALAMLGIELAVEAGAAGFVGGPAAVGWRIDLLERFSFSPALFAWMLEDGGRLSLGNLARFVTYPFVHGSFTHMLFGAVFTLALGKFVGEAMRQGALVALWLIASVAGALPYAALGAQPPLFGAMPPAYGLIGALTFLLWQRARQRGQNPAAAFQLIGFLVLLQLVFASIGGGFGPQIVAELAGFAAGFLASFVLVPGGWQAVKAQLRRR